MAVAKFNALITDLVGRLEKKARSTEERTMIYRLKGRIATALSFDRAAMIAVSAPIFIDFSDKILVDTKAERDKFFLEMDAKAEYEKRKEHISASAASSGEPADDEYVHNLINMMRSKYSSCSPTEQDAIYAAVRGLLAESAEYLIEVSKSSTKD